jgi:hypothetical protein
MFQRVCVRQQRRSKGTEAMTVSEQEAEWRAEFEKIGTTLVHGNLQHGYFPEPKRQVAYRWLSEQEAEGRRRDEEMHWYVQWTFWAAVGALAVAAIGVVVTLLK